MSTTTTNDSVPLLERNRKNIDQWERRFQDYSISKNWRGIINGTEIRPLALTEAEIRAIPVASRYAAQKDRNTEIKDYNSRSDSAFGGLCRAMQNDNLLYASSQLDQLRLAPTKDPAAAYTFIMATLRPSHVDAQMTAEARISNFHLLKKEPVPEAYQRLLSYVNCLDPNNRPDDSALKRHMKRAIKADPSASSLYMSKVEAMMDRDPPITFAVFCQGLMRKYEESQAETAQEAALNTETKQHSDHHDNEKETANYSKGKGGRGGGRGKGRVGKGSGRHFGKGQSDARIGAMYYVRQ